MLFHQSVGVWICGACGFFFSANLQAGLRQECLGSGSLSDTRRSYLDRFHRGVVPKPLSAAERAARRKPGG
eukprot:439798-Pyramimonas_sp.AAC.1